MAGTAAVAGLATALWKKLIGAPVPAAAPREGPSAGDAGGGSGQDPGPARPMAAPDALPPPPAVAPVVLRGPVAVPAAAGAPGAADAPLPDAYLLLDEAVMAAVQRDLTVAVRLPGGGRLRRPARQWWREALHWLVARPDLSIALTALDPLGPGHRACTAIEAATGIVSRPGTRSRLATFDLGALVAAPGRISEGAAASAAARALAGLARGGTARLPCRRRVHLTGLHPALRRLGVDPRAYRGLRLTESLLAAACRALDAAADAGAAAPRRWPDPAGDMARLGRGRLSVLSPFAFLPPAGGDARIWLDLLPAMRVVDAVGWRRPRGCPDCGVAELAALYRLTWAVRRGCCT